jgi:dipeptidyl aminopeptidase/acylaminoacyl peptidase
LEKREGKMMDVRKKGKPLTIEALSKVTTVYDFDVSKVDSKVCLSWDKEGLPNLYYIEDITKIFNVVKLTQGTESSLSPNWAPNGELIAYTSDKGGNESFDIFTIDLETCNIRNVTNDPGTDNNTPIYSMDGSKIAFISNKDGKMLNLYVMNSDGTELTKVTNSKMPIFEYCWSPDVTRLAFTKGYMESEIWLCKTDGTEERKLISHPKAEDIVSFGGWSPDGTMLAFVSNSNSGYFDIGLYNFTNSEITWFEQSSNEKSNPVWSPDGSKIAYLEIINCSQVIKVKDFSDGSPKLVSPRVGCASNIKWSHDGSKIYFNYTSPKNPSDLWVTDLFSSALPIVKTLPSEIDSENSLVFPEIIRYRSFDGLSIQALVYKPDRKGGGKFQALVSPHGGPEAQSQVAWSFNIQYLVSHGYLVICPNYRGSTGYGRKFVRMSDRDLGGGDLEDVVYAAEYLVDEGVAESDQIGIFGGSYGGYATMMALTKYPKVFKAGAAIVPFVNWETEFETEREYLRYYDEHKVGRPEENLEFYHDRSPINFIERIEAPLLLLAGANDPRCPIGESRQILEKMKALGKICEAKFYEDEGHGFRKISNRIDSCERVLKFFQKYMPITEEEEEE